jgi:hypothetical protein
MKILPKPMIDILKEWLLDEISELCYRPPKVKDENLRKLLSCAYIKHFGSSND